MVEIIISVIIIFCEMTKFHVLSLNLLLPCYFSGFMRITHGMCEGGAVSFFLKQMSAQHVQIVSNNFLFLMSDETHACCVVPHLVFRVSLH